MILQIETTETERENITVLHKYNGKLHKHDIKVNDRLSFTFRSGEAIHVVNHPKDYENNPQTEI